MNRRLIALNTVIIISIAVLLASCSHHRINDNIKDGFLNPPDSARPGVYWYFMDGNLSREGMTADLESMKKAGIGYALFLEVNVGVPRGKVERVHGHAGPQVEEVERTHHLREARQTQAERRQILLHFVAQNVHGGGGQQRAARDHLLRFGHAQGIGVASCRQVVLQAPADGIGKRERQRLRGDGPLGNAARVGALHLHGVDAGVGAGGQAARVGGARGAHAAQLRAPAGQRKRDGARGSLADGRRHLGQRR